MGTELILTLRPESMTRARSDSVVSPSIPRVRPRARARALYVRGVRPSVHPSTREPEPGPGPGDSAES